MTVFLSHSAWGAQSPNRQSSNRTSTTHLFVHHSATGKPADIDAAKAQVRAIQADHLQRTVSATNSTLWADVAYNIFVFGGAILEGRGWDVRGGGTGPGNKVPHPSGSWDNVSVSICVLGNYRNDTLDDDTRTSLVAALSEAQTRYGDGLIVLGDRDVNATQCPGDNLYSLIPELWAEALGDDMTLENLVAAMGPSCRLEGGFIEINLKEPDGSDAGWWKLGDAIEFIHRNGKAAKAATSGGP